MHRLIIGRWLSRKTGGLFCTKQDRMDGLNSIKELSLLYHRLNQLQLVGNIKSPGLIISLRATNLSDIATSIMLPEDIIDINITSALRLKQTFPKLPEYFFNSLLSCAKNASKLCNNVPTKFKWLLTPYGAKFLKQYSVKFNIKNDNCNDSIFSRLINQSDPLYFFMRVRLQI